MIDQKQMMAVLNKYRGDAIVIPTMSAVGPWVETSHLQLRDVQVSGAMGKASSFGLGIAMAQPNVKVLVIDGDGSLEMNLGTLVTIGNKRPRNLYHFVMENGVYAVTGGQPIPGSGQVSFTELARAAGYAATYEFDDLEEFALQIEGILRQKGPVFVTIKIVPEIQNEPIGRRQRGAVRPTAVAFKELRDSLSSKVSR